MSATVAPESEGVRLMHAGLNHLFDALDNNDSTRRDDDRKLAEIAAVIRPYGLTVETLLKMAEFAPNPAAAPKPADAQVDAKAGAAPAAPAEPASGALRAGVPPTPKKARTADASPRNTKSNPKRAAAAARTTRKSAGKPKAPPKSATPKKPGKSGKSGKATVRVTGEGIPPDNTLIETVRKGGEDGVTYDELMDALRTAGYEASPKFVQAVMQRMSDLIVEKRVSFEKGDGNGTGGRLRVGKAAR